jgi:hypothetical protein
LDGGLILTNNVGKFSIIIIGNWPIPKVYITAPNYIKAILDDEEVVASDENCPVNIFPLRNFLKSRTENQTFEGFENLKQTRKNRFAFTPNNPNDKKPTGFDILKHELKPENIVRGKNKWKNIPSHYRELDMEKIYGTTFLYKLEIILFALSQTIAD